MAEPTAPTEPTPGTEPPAAAPPAAASPPPAAEPPAGDPPVAEPPGAPARKPWHVTRIDQLTGEKYELQRRLEALERGQTPPAPAEPPSGTPPGAKTFTQVELNAEVARRAQALASETSFNAKSNEIYQAGKTKFQDFDQSLQAFNQLGGLDRPTVEAAMETDAPEALLYAMGKDLDRTSALMALPPVRRAVAMAKWAGEIGKAPPSAPSKAPPPVSGVVHAAGGRATPSLADDNLTDAEWIALRQKQVAERRTRH